MQATLALPVSVPVPMPTGSLEAYIQTVNRFPLLTARGGARAGAALARTGRPRRRRQPGAVAPAPGRLDLAPVPGLRPAARRPDPGRQYRPDEGREALRPGPGRAPGVSYAMHWIKAEIHEYILQNWRMVKVATTKAQRKLFFNLRSMKQGLGDAAHARDRRRARGGAASCNVKPEEVLEMETRLSGGDIALEPTRTTTARRATRRSPTWPTTRRRADARARGAERDGLPADGIATALESLDAAQPPHRRGALAEGERRRLGGMTLHDLAAEFTASAPSASARSRRGAEEDAQGAGAGLPARRHRDGPTRPSCPFSDSIASGQAADRAARPVWP